MEVQKYGFIRKKLQRQREIKKKNAWLEISTNIHEVVFSRYDYWFFSTVTSHIQAKHAYSPAFGGISSLNFLEYECNVRWKMLG